MLQRHTSRRYRKYFDSRSPSSDDNDRRRKRTPVQEIGGIEFGRDPLPIAPRELTAFVSSSKRTKARSLEPIAKSASDSSHEDDRLPPQKKQRIRESSADTKTSTKSKLIEKPATEKPTFEKTVTENSISREKSVPKKKSKKRKRRNSEEVRLDVKNGTRTVEITRKPVRHCVSDGEMISSKEIKGILRNKEKKVAEVKDPLNRGYESDYPRTNRRRYQSITLIPEKSASKINNGVLCKNCGAMSDYEVAYNSTPALFRREADESSSAAEINLLHLQWEQQQRERRERKVKLKIRK